MTAGPQVASTAAGGGTAPDPWCRPDGVDDDTVRACGLLGEAVEWIERARGHLYEFHHLIGHADELFGDAAEALSSAGHVELAAQLETEVIGRNVLDGRWTFQVVEEFDDGYHHDVLDLERRVRSQLLQGRRHVHEAELKERRRTRGRDGHEARP